MDTQQVPRAAIFEAELNHGTSHKKEGCLTQLSQLDMLARFALAY